MMTTGGEVLLNCVHPEMRFQGASTALMEAMEAKAASIGLSECRLHTTRTAETFYLSRGYLQIEGAEPGLMSRRWDRVPGPRARTACPDRVPGLRARTACPDCVV